MPEISKEIQSLRSENSKTFDLGGGKRRLEAHIGAVYYKDNYADPSELWKDTDLTWEGNRITKAPYELALDGKKLTLKDKKTGEVSTIELLESKPVGLNFEILPEFSAVRFRHTLPSDKVPFEARFKVTGNIPFGTHAWDDEEELPLETTFKDGILTEKLSSLPRPAKGNIRIDPTWQVGANSDDCVRRLTPDYWLLTPLPYVRAGVYNSANYQYGSGMRFTDITIPKYATIDTAYLTLRCRYIKEGLICNTRISAEDVGSAVTFSTQADFDTRWAARTTARVDWDAIPVWTPDEDYDSPEIKTVIQEIVNRAGWASGNDIVIFWDDFEDRSTHASGCERQAYAYAGSTEFAPKLVVTYFTAAPTVTTQAVTDIRKITATGNGTITDIGAENCDERGVCWNTTGDPTVADSKSEETDSFGTGAFTRPMTDLTPGEHYYVRAYAHNSYGYEYGDQVEFDTWSGQLIVYSTYSETGWLLAQGHPDDGYLPVHDSPTGAGYESLPTFGVYNSYYKGSFSYQDRYYVGRGTLRFVTSGLPDNCAIQSATLRLVASQILVARGDGLYVQLVSGVDLHPTLMVGEDYGALLDKTTPIGQVVQIGDIVLGQDIEFDLASYRDNIEKGADAYTRIGVRVGADIESLVPAYPEGNSVAVIFDSGGASEATKPKLTINYEAIQIPTMTTDPATLVEANTATLNGTLDGDGGVSCDCGFEWGETDAYGNTTSIEAKTTGQTFAQAITGLIPGVTYHFRAFATNFAGTGYGSDAVFRTAYPSDPVARVSSIRHIAMPGSFRMQIGVGDLGFDVDVAEATVRSALDTAKEIVKPPEGLPPPRKFEPPPPPDSIVRPPPPPTTTAAAPPTSLERMIERITTKGGREGPMLHLPEPLAEPEPKRYTLEMVLAQYAETKKKADEYKRRFLGKTPGL